MWCDIRRRFDGVPALFLDRDGVIVEEVSYLDRPDKVRLIDGVATVNAEFNRRDIPVVLVTNQSGIGRGFYDWAAFAAVQDTIATALSARGAHVDAVLACAYHASANPPYDIVDHPWRKPRPGMILEAARRMDLVLARSWIDGDKADDLAAGRSADLAGGILVTTGHGAGEQVKARELAQTRFAVAIAPSLTQAVETLRGALGA